MDHTRIFPAGDSPALDYAARFLRERGVSVGQNDATHILLNVPTKTLPPIGPGQTVIGGNLASLPSEISRLDLLQDEVYVAENAALTADCALRLLGQHLQIAFRGCPILVIGWGRIGKCLASQLKNMDARVTVAARKPSDRAMAQALGHAAIPLEKIRPEDYRGILNTAPAPVLQTEGGLCIDLASSPGIAGENVIWARGLPGKMLPESSGKLIAQAILRHLEEDGI